MKLTEELHGGRLTFHFSGELDHHAARDAMDRIEGKLEILLPRDCVLDFSGLSFMDSSGIALIIKAYKRMNGIGGRIWVENVPAQPMKVLDASGLERIIRITETA